MPDWKKASEALSEAQFLLFPKMEPRSKREVRPPQPPKGLRKEPADVQRAVKALLQKSNHPEDLVNEARRALRELKNRTEHVISERLPQFFKAPITKREDSYEDGWTDDAYRSWENDVRYYFELTYPGLIEMSTNVRFKIERFIDSAEEGLTTYKSRTSDKGVRKEDARALLTSRAAQRILREALKESISNLSNEDLRFTPARDKILDHLDSESDLDWEVGDEEDEDSYEIGNIEIRWDFKFRKPELVSADITRTHVVVRARVLVDVYRPYWERA